MGWSGVHKVFIKLKKCPISDLDWDGKINLFLWQI
jgi:hypothetical protein